MVNEIGGRWLCYIIAEGFFFILSFFVGYILSFGLVRLRTIQLSARVGAHIECRCSHSYWEDVTISDVIIKTSDRKWDCGCEWCHAWKRWAVNFGWFLKKSRQLRFEAGLSELIFGPVMDHRMPARCWSDGTVSIVEIVSLSSRVEKPKSQDGNKSFVPELKKVISVSGFLCMWTFYVSVYLYILRNHILAILPPYSCCFAGCCF